MAKKDYAQPMQAPEPPCRYPAADLIGRAKAIFGTNPEVVAGALHGVEGMDFTIDEVKALIAEYHSRKVII